MREKQKKSGVDLVEIVKTRLFKERKEPIEIARIIEMPLCDIITIKNKETQKGKPLEGAIKISDDNETEAKGLCKVFSPSDIVAFISADGSR